MNELRWPETEEAKRAVKILSELSPFPEKVSNFIDWIRACVLIQVARDCLGQMGWQIAERWHSKRPSQHTWTIMSSNGEAPAPPPIQYPSEMDALIAGVLAADALLKAMGEVPPEDYRTLRLEALLRRWLGYRHFGLPDESATELARDTYKELEARP